MNQRGLGVTRVRVAGLDQKVGIVDPESPDAATDFPCCLMPCEVVPFVAAAFAFSMSRRVTGNLWRVTSMWGGCWWCGPLIFDL